MVLLALETHDVVLVAREQAAGLRVGDGLLRAEADDLVVEADELDADETAPGEADGVHLERHVHRRCRVVRLLRRVQEELIWIELAELFARVGDLSVGQLAAVGVECPVLQIGRGRGKLEEPAR